MTMQTTNAHRNGPHRGRKSRRASAARPVQAVMFGFPDDGGAADNDAQGHRAIRAGRPADGAARGSAVRHEVSLGSFARAKARYGESAPGPDRAVRRAGRAAVPESLGKFGLRRLSDPRGGGAHSHESAQKTTQAQSGRGVRAGQSAGEELPPLIPFVVSEDRPGARSHAMSRFAVPSGSVLDPRSVLDASPVHESGAVLESFSVLTTSSRLGARSAPEVRYALEPTAAEVRLGPRAARRIRRARLTTRGHIAVMVLIATAIAGTSAVVNASHPGAAPVAAAQEVVVHPGDTVESIASRFASPSDRADLIALIRAANGLSGSTDTPLPAGDYLIVPAN